MSDQKTTKGKPIFSGPKTNKTFSGQHPNPIPNPIEAINITEYMDKDNLLRQINELKDKVFLREGTIKTLRSKVISIEDERKELKKDISVYEEIVKNHYSFIPQIHKIKERIDKKYGEDLQAVVCIEELSELIHVLCKFIRLNKASKLMSTYDIASKTIEEIADVTIMLEQIKYMFGIKQSVIYTVICEKIKRQLERMEKDSQKNPT